MPNRFPEPHVERDSDRAEQSIREYVELGRDLAGQIAGAIRFRRQREQAGELKPSKLKKASRVCIEFADQHNLSYAYVNNAKLVAQAFPGADLEAFLAACRNANYIPSREIVISLSRVPAGRRQAYIQSAIQHRWTASRLKMFAQQEFGKRSNGKKDPEAPESREETQRDLTRAIRKLTAISQTLLCSRHGVVAPAIRTDFRVPRQVPRQLQRALKALNDIAEYVESAEAAA